MAKKHYLARDKDMVLYLYTKKPKRSVELEMFISDGGELDEIDKSFFPKVTWENSPIEVELKIKKEKKWTITGLRRFIPYSSSGKKYILTKKQQ